MDGFPYRGTYHGPEAVRDHVFVRIVGDWEGFTLTVDDVIELILPRGWKKRSLRSIAR